MAGGGMAAEKKEDGEIFDDWPDRYDRWFETPIGRLVKKYETDILMEMLQPGEQEKILDVGCGTGVFTKDVLGSGAHVTGLDLSLPMLRQAADKLPETVFRGVVADMTALPFGDGAFDKTFSMTAIEFVSDAKKAIDELNRVTREKGTIVLTTLNSLSPWARRRLREGEKGHSLFANMHFRSPDEMVDLVNYPSTVRTAIHFLKSDGVQEAEKIEEEGMLKNSDTGAFLALMWVKK